ncbi:RNA binding S1 domain protein [Desulfofarcimen acetoxidans DSM 771]|uniref:RNA binding S1 domain protein n=1 Tax=Desulfofarcimen acetoxidans (strain ATCC 49208 / DSM 771 / KCTC 5769 / VKM B-1644 / 5575) TaxID=485916 RepID=C8VX48_DESAS|nr:Tex family protein [Desulfofarcimen acetoxidans]ACV62624.1 RNA binding S1 domain protein [Desulfofarcimen acetoxidans DSM 771]
MDIEQLIIRHVAGNTGLPLKKVESTVQLLDAGNTVPFISRYRKEMTGELNEVEIRSIEEQLKYQRNLQQRKEEVVRLIEEQGKLTDELQQKIMSAGKLNIVEDLYRPYRQKRKTRAGVAREKGLEPLALYILSLPKTGDPGLEAQIYVNEEKGILTAEDALQGACDIIAETVADDPEIRGWVRRYIFRNGLLVTEAKEKETRSVYEMYYEYSEAVRTVAPHRTLAVNRGEKEGILKVRIEVPEEEIYGYLNRRWLKNPVSVTVAYVQSAVIDGYKRLLFPAVERDVRNELTEKAEEQAIKIFSKNLRQLLLQPPVKGEVVLGVDPGFRTGCKWAVVDDTGKLWEVGVVYPTPPQKKITETKEIFRQLADRYGITVIAIGNGTASRETELVVVDFIKEYVRPLQYIIVSEAGASVYSASELAAREFPKLDVAERSAVSIARRLQDPLAELVKIDPKAVGVGQYQHDVAHKRLEESLASVVESVVNHVGVDLNTASPSLLSHVAGVNMTVAQKIVEFRENEGKFKNRSQLKKVPRLGPKTFEQCVGFLRISDGENTLDKTPIHPESYDQVKKFLKEIGCSMMEVGSGKMKERLKNIVIDEMALKLDIGLPTLKDIIESLEKPGRDPREELPKPIFRTDVLKIEDLQVGMELKGTVRNVVDFGAFVDIGVKVDGMVHKSELGTRRFSHPMDVLSVGDIVTVKVLSVDLERQRVALTLNEKH